MKNKLLISLTILSLTLLNGCQLAKTDIIPTGQDRLIGCFVTTEYVDTFDFDKYISSNSSKLGKGDITIDIDEIGYDNKLYATMKESPVTNSEGRQSTELTWEFEGIKGYYFLSPLVEIDGEKTRYSTHSESLGDLDIKIMATDETESISLSATLYTVPKSNNVAFYANPIYQSPDGSIYLLGGSGLSVQGAKDEGPLMSTDIKDTHTSNFGEESKTATNEISLSIEVKFPLKESTILEMGKNHSLIKETPIDLNNIPNDFRPSQNTEYIILENIKIDSSQKEYTSVEVFDKKKMTMVIFKDNDQGIVEKRSLNLLWTPSIP